MPFILRILRTAILVGSVSFAAGFFGPLILDPGANQGPLLGIFFTGPLGFALGLVWGLWREIRRRKPVVTE